MKKILDGKILFKEVYNGCNILTIGKARYVQVPNGNVGSNYHGFLNAELYCLRIYGRALTDEEVIKNYETSKNYHKLLESLEK